METRARKKSNVTPKLTLVGNPVLPRADSGKMDAFVSSEARDGEAIINGADDMLLRELPAFERHEESTAIELFYDLFFVANLTTFSNIHEINDTKTLTSYVGFFCILWFTWCLTSLYDIRFVTDSLLARIAKGVHLGVMVGLAVSAPKFVTTDITPQLKVIALILTVSRLVLALQYFLVIYHVREYKKTIVPLSMMGILNVIAGVLYLGISFAFKSSKYAYRALYVIAGFEVVVNIGVSWYWKVLSFKGTHLIERMTLLTLYILGEGVIEVLKSVAKISQAQDSWSPGNIGTLSGAIASIYLFYMLYFDSLNRHHIGSFRQQLWSFLHFPFHVALVLCLSGMAQFIIWQEIMEVFYGFASELGSMAKTFTTNANPDSNSAEEYVIIVQGAVNDTLQLFTPEDPTALNDKLNEAYESIKDMTEEYFSSPSNDTLSAMSDSLSQVIAIMWNGIMDSYGFEPPDTESEHEPAAIFHTEAALETAQLIYYYFYIATGFTLVLIGILNIVNVRSYTRWSWVRFTVHLLFGIAMCLLSLLARGDGTGALDISSTAWPLPIVAIVILVVLAAHHISWEDKEAEESTGEKQYHFLPHWRPNRQSSNQPTA